MELLVDVVLLAFLAVIGLAIIRLDSLFAVIMLTGIFTLVSASLYVSMDAADVAFTEAAVGAGIATLLFLCALVLTDSAETSERKFSLPALLLVTMTGAALMFGVADMPAFGDPASPVHQYLAERYIEQSPQEIGIPNMVTSVLASYRGYDTMGEVAVIFTAGVAVLLLLGRSRKRN